jgi:hypothetical protein
MAAKLTIRARRRQRQRRKNDLDAFTLKKIGKNILWSMATWNGSRCPGCGIKVRPHWLVNYSGSFLGGWMTAFGSACRRTKCPGENPDWETQIKEHEI